MPSLGWRGHAAGAWRQSPRGDRGGEMGRGRGQARRTHTHTPCVVRPSARPRPRPLPSTGNCRTSAPTAARRAQPHTAKRPARTAGPLSLSNSTSLTSRNSTLTLPVPLSSHVPDSLLRRYTFTRCRTGMGGAGGGEGEGGEGGAAAGGGAGAPSSPPSIMAPGPLGRGNSRMKRDSESESGAVLSAHCRNLLLLDVPGQVRGVVFE